jgi:hypothetical protein
MGRKARLKRDRRHSAKPGDMARELRQRLNAAGTMVVDGDPELPKISDALLALVRPILDEVGADNITRVDLQRIVTVAATVWNASLLPDSQSLFEDARGLVGEDSLLDTLVERRRSLFANDRRFITDFEVSDITETGEFRVSAAYTFLKPKGSSPELQDVHSEEV